MNTPMPVILICTVGGSHQPILTAIRDAAPDYVCFLCTGKDAASGQAGSDVQILGKGNFIKARWDDEKPTLPNIPTQAGLRAEQFEVVLIAADDLDESFTAIRLTLANLARRFPQGRFLADYTGGTKTMTAALVTAALEDDAVELQLVTGSRVDLVKVRSGMETTLAANVERIRLQRAMAAHVASWQRYAYAEAAQGLESLKMPRDRHGAATLQRLRDLSRAFDAWDRFDHATAYGLLDAYRPRIGHALALHLNTLKGLLQDSPKQEPLRLLDLWRNAQRRAAQGRYDDAVARVYRLLEWSAQWLLKRHCGIDTGHIAPEQAPPGIELTTTREGKLQAGLFAAWELVGRLVEGPAQLFIREQRNRLQDRIKVRNQSILAHGFTPIRAADWEAMADWIGGPVLKMLLDEMADWSVKLPPQLPTAPDWETEI